MVNNLHQNITSNRKMTRIVKFLSEKNIGRQPSEDMLKAFKMSEKSGDNTVWITDMDVLELTKTDDNNIFICDHFDGKLFDQLKKKKFRIYGPRYIIYCHKEDIRADQLEHPAYTATMKGLAICCTNIARDRRLRLHEKIQQMGGIVCPSLTEKVTHVVADQVSSKKYHLAAALKKPIFSSEWVDRCWNEGKQEFIHANDVHFKEYLCPIFKGLCITVTQLSRVERMNLKEIVEANGGIYDGCLKVNKTTHLVAKDCTGDKYEMAINKHIYCVTSSWVKDSVKNGVCADEQHYLLSRSKSDKSDTSTSSELRESKEKTINETYLSTTIAEDKKQETSSSVMSESRGFVIDEDKLNAAGQFLDGCKIVLSGIVCSKFESILKKVLNKGGATRFDQINEHVTHVIVGVLSNQLEKMLVDCNLRPHVVTLSWLEESINAGKALDEKLFYCFDIPAKNALSPIRKQAKLTSSSSSQTIQCISQLEPSTEDTEDVENVVSQYLPNCTPREEADDLLFKGLVFGVFGFSTDDFKDLKQFVIDAGGTVNNEADVLNYAIFPMCGTFNPNATILHTATFFWLMSCIENERIHNLSEHALYAPTYCDVNLKPLSDCVIGTSQYGSSEKQAIDNLAGLLGARCQERFSKINISSKGLFANTHLITNQPNGKKYDGAISWNIPVVSLDWLVECAKAGERLSERPYLIGKSKENCLFQQPASPSFCSVLPGEEAKDVRVTSTPKGPSKVDLPCFKSPLMINRLSEITPERNPPQLNTYDTPEVFKKALAALSENSYNEIMQHKKKLLPKASFENALLDDGCSNNELRKCQSTPQKECETSVNEKAEINFKESSSDDGYNEILERFKHGYATPYLPKRIMNDKSLRHEDSVNGNASVSISPYISPRDADKPPKIRLREARHCLLDSPANKKPKLDNIELSKLFKRAIRKVHKNIIKDDKGAQEYTSSSSEEELPLSGVILVISKRFEFYQAELNKLAEALGAKCRWKYDSKATHFIHEGRADKETREALADGKFVLSREWLYACRDQNKRVNEVDYPYTFDSRMKLDVLRKQSIVSPRVIPKSSKVLPEPSKSPVPMPRPPTDLLKAEIDKLKAAAKLAKNKGTKEKSSFNVSTVSFKEGRKKPPTKPRKGSENENRDVISFESVPIGWEEEAPMGDTVTTTMDLEEETITKPPPRILLAGVSNKLKLKYQSMTSELGGSISFSKEFAPNFTHLVTGSPNLTEKVLAGIANGMWILKPSYLESCYEKGKFVEESEHEWIVNNSFPINSKEDTLVKAAHNWRLKIAEMRESSEAESCGAFHKWEVIIYTDEARTASFKRILLAGGAKIINARPPFTNVRGATHAFMELSKVPSDKVDFKWLVKQETLCLKFEYITSYLIGNDDVNENLLPEVKHLTSGE